VNKIIELLVPKRTGIFITLDAIKFSRRILFYGASSLRQALQFHKGKTVELVNVSLANTFIAFYFQIRVEYKTFVLSILAAVE
jgi:hypothetical protein